MPSPFPLNAWYAAAWDVDLKHALFPRTICGKHVVMYRKADGQVAALEDACWHRLVPLSKGRLEGAVSPLAGGLAECARWGQEATMSPTSPSSTRNRSAA